MTKIYKYPLALTDRQTVRVPLGALVLSVAEQAGRLCLWAVVDADEKETEERVIFVVGTGNPLPEDFGAFVGTVVTADGALVWHVFEAGDCECAECEAERAALAQMN